MADNRRSSTRHTVSIPSKLTIDGKTTDATMVNLSLGGALIANVKIAMGKQVQISFRLPTLEDMIDLGAIARWTDDSGVGIQFDSPRAREVWALNEYFKQLA